MKKYLVTSLCYISKYAMSKILFCFICLLFIGFLHANESFVSETSVAQETKQVKGRVLDENGEALPGATIQIKGTTRGVMADMDGTFTINVTATDQLDISFIGYQMYSIIVGNQTEITVTLTPKVNELDEVTIVAFAKQKKESVLASITTINPGELKVPSSNLSTALAGRISGLVSYQRSGEPGQDDASFFVRGVTSLTYASGPLILIDGVEMSSADLSRMQPDDIASFSIMKDAAATALYGARGANGVILVTTKEGREGQATISVRFETSISEPTQRVELVNPVDYMKLNNEAVRTRNGNVVLPYSREKIDNTLNPDRNKYVYPANDWYDMLFKDRAINYRTNFNVSGGGKVARYYVAASYSQDNGVLNVDKKNNFNNNIDLKRYLLRSNININLTKTTEAVVRLHGSFDDYQGPLDGGSALYQKVMRSDPVLFAPYYEPDAATAYAPWILFGNAGNATYINPYADMVKGYNEYNRSTILAQFELKQNLDFVTPGLSVRGLFSTNRYSYYSVRRAYKPFYYSISAYDKTSDEYTLEWLNTASGAAAEWLTSSEDPKEITTTNYTEVSAIYNRMFADKHDISGMMVFTMRNYVEAINATDIQLSLPHRNIGVSGRATYAFDSRYFTEFNFGYNGSERFAKNERFGFFPSIGFGWIVSNESFWNENLKKTISKLKFKGTYGLVGNDAIGNAEHRFYYLSNVLMAAESGKAYRWGYDFGYRTEGVKVSRYANDKITWEKSKKLNLGIELELFNKLEFIADVYTEDRSNILLTRADVPAEMGLEATPQVNLGKAEGRGLDMSIDYQHSFNTDFWITGRANFTYAKAKYTQYAEVDNSATPWKSVVGNAVSQEYGYVAERLFIDDYEVANSPLQQFGTDEKIMGGDIKYKDINNDGQINTLDMVPIGYPKEPRMIYGFGVSVGYRQFDLSFFFQGLAQESFWIDSQKTAPFVDTDESSEIISKNTMLQAYADSYWSEDNRDLHALWPRLSDKVISNNTQTSTWFMRDGSFLRLKSMEFGYTLPNRITEKIKMKTFRLYLSGTNLFVISKFKLWDPEMAGNGLGYPLQRVYNVGLQITF